MDRIRDCGRDGLIVDLFAGGGGASAGIEAALGRPVDVAINHDAVALAVHKANHPRTRHLDADIWEVRPTEATEGRPVALLWASPDCTHFSIAKGDVPKKQNIRSLAWAVVRWAAAVRPSVIFLENVAEFRGWGPLGADGRPDKRRMGQTFIRWRRKLERLGYVVDHRVLDASAYGAPTRRKRLFIVARCDGQPVRWPLPTHGKGPGLLTARTAAECIDWSLPCPSIFERKKPLAEKTLWRIAQGIRRFVLENPRPFIVRYNGGLWRGQGIDEPLTTQDTSNRVGLVAPSIVKVNHGRWEPRGEAAEEPLSTVTATQRGHALVAPTLIQTSWGEREGQRPRYLDIHQPLGTVVAGGQKHALVAAFLAKHFGGVVGHDLERPVGAVTAKDHHSLAAATLIRFNHDDTGVPIGTPMPTVTADSNHIAEVRAFLTAFYGSDGTLGKGQRLDEPARTLTAKHRLGLVTVEGTDYQIVDIGMRMLEPHELLAAQFGRFSAAYDLSAARTKSAKVRLIGNSVCPEMAEVLVRSNAPSVSTERAA
jgi:DNA (cytosine-5)-methyltransferase 1